MQEIDNILAKTKSQIKSVDAPDHILTRAKQQFENLQEVASPRFVWSTAFATVLLLVFNVYVIGQQSTTDNDTTEMEQYVESINLNSSNQLYTNE